MVGQDEVVPEERVVEAVDELVSLLPVLGLDVFHQSVGIHGVRVQSRTVVELQSLPRRHGLDPPDLHRGHVGTIPLGVAVEHRMAGDLLRSGIQSERSEVESALLGYAEVFEGLHQPRLRYVAEGAGEIGPILDDHLVHLTGSDRSSPWRGPPRVGRNACVSSSNCLWTRTI